jgi:hypothetical protein
MIFEESGEENGIMDLALWIYQLIAFPGFFLSKISFLNNVGGLILSIIIGVLSYSLLIEMMIIKYRSYKLKRSTYIRN